MLYLTVLTVINGFSRFLNGFNGFLTLFIDTIEAASEPRRALEHLIASKDLAVATRSLQGEVRYCSECSHIKVNRKYSDSGIKCSKEKLWNI